MLSTGSPLASLKTDTTDENAIYQGTVDEEGATDEDQSEDMINTTRSSKAEIQKNNWRRCCS